MDTAPGLTHGPYAISLGRTQALHAARRLASVLADKAPQLFYAGPLAVAGSYVRDLALLRDPTNIDVFLDAAYVSDDKTAEAVAAHIANSLGVAYGVKVSRAKRVKGLWDKGVQHVIRVTMDLGAEQQFAYIDGVMVPKVMHFVFVSRDALKRAGYDHRVVNDGYNQENFLKAVLRLFPLRANALGAVSHYAECSPFWDLDMYNQRMVMQFMAVGIDNAEEVASRIRSLTQDKYKDWTLWYETSQAGDIEEAAPPGGAAIE